MPLSGFPSPSICSLSVLPSSSPPHSASTHLSSFPASSLPLPSPQSFLLFLSFPCPFRTLLPFASFIVPCGSISASAGNARAQLRSQESRVRGGEKRARGEESPLRLRKGSSVQWGTDSCTLLSLCSNVLCALGQVICSLWASLSSSAYREGNYCSMSLRQVRTWGWAQIAAFSSSSPMILCTGVIPVLVQIPIRLSL